MGGENPYLKKAAVRLPTKSYRVTFLPMNVTVEVDPKKIPYSRDGRPGSLLEIALAHGIEIDHACGGVCACSTCHVILKEGLSSLSPATEDEDDMLDNAPGLTPTSRLACQSVADGSADIVVEVPSWNRNLVREH